jgi:flagellar basal-body rod protein FlgC
MGFLSSMDISTSALTAQRMRMDVISENIANADTTRTETGEPYRRRAVVLTQKQATSFSSYYEDAKASTAGRGVYVSEIVEDQSDFVLEYNPTHPDADADGYVSYPNVDEVEEMVDMMSATRSFEANVTALNATKSMAMKALEIGS